MTLFESLDAMDWMTGDAVINLLYRLGDDEFIAGHRDSEFAEPAPGPEDRAAFSSILQEEAAHAQAYYEMLHELGEPEPQALAEERKPRQFRCASLVSLPDQKDWVSAVLRQFLYDAAENVRLSALASSALVPLERLAARLLDAEKRHLAYGRTWVLGLAGTTAEARDKAQAALHYTYPYALGLFEPTEADEPLAQAGISLWEEELRGQWESAVAPVLSDAGLTVPGSARPIHGGRVGRQPLALTELLDNVRSRC